MSKGTYLLEIGLEEMPARFVTNSMNQLAEKVEKWLKENSLNCNEIKRYSTPRRLAIIIEGLDEKQADMEEEAKGPSKKIAQDKDGNWSQAAEGFSRGQGVSVDQLYFKEVKGEEYVFVKKYTKGQDTVSLLTDLKEVVQNLQFPKNMKWGSYQLRYVRPIKWIISLFDDVVVPFEITDVQADNKSEGHRFLGENVVVEHAQEYLTTLLEQFVIVDPVERKKGIESQIKAMAENEGWSIPIDEDLLEEVNNLVEYPTALFGSFDERFLGIPEDVLVTSMREHQRYFPVKNKEGKLLPHFITIRNGDHRHLENVQKGNEKVLRARLADAEFFYKEDLKTPLENQLKRLESIVYHEELGSIGDKVRRIKDLAATIGKSLNQSTDELKKVDRTAQLSKADLVTLMVGEFPELEGRMGEEYALKSGEDKDVSKGIYEHYLPKQSGDSIPTTTNGSIVSVSDKIDTVVTSFGIGLVPTGSQDPHGLRRQTAGVLQIFNGKSWTIDLLQCFDEGLTVAEKRGLLKRDKEAVRDDLIDFIMLRLKNLLQEQGIRYDVVEAVLKNDDIGQVHTLVKKANFLNSQLKKPEFKQVVEAFSRVTNISKKASQNGEFDKGLLKEKEEIALLEIKEDVASKVRSLLGEGSIEEAYNELRRLEPFIHQYFDNIMVMADDAAIKNNRLNHMRDTASLITTFADFQSIVFHSGE
ncbi:glycine--tRNA ligase subunit beta [Evansella sp. AB-P1]|uniref:glycine--tRNA ligase subunit beta n=1 Tax=Evansella sp. AB-P1 TaxID=3037653 RepID=UPI00241E3EB7|nr:glycine--tRNA ligase subunit beta [Evansella sp. AB-P1]MDG5786557.1 glycine--tRNA ligase subunit beta [Evansella sp. AB-P1]